MVDKLKQPEEDLNESKKYTRREAMKRIAKISTAALFAPLVVGMRLASAGEVEEISRYQSLADAGDIANPVNYSDYTSYASSHSYTSAVYQSQSERQGGGGYYNVSPYFSSSYYSAGYTSYPYNNYYSQRYSSYSSFRYGDYFPYRSFSYSQYTNRYNFHANML